MLKRQSINYTLFCIIIDIIITLASLAFVTAIRTDLNALPFVREISGKVYLPLFVYIVFPIVWVAVFSLFSIYDERKNLKFSAELRNITQGTIFATAAQAGILYLTYRDISRALFISYIGLAYILFLIYRIALRQVMQKGNVEAFKIRVVIAGAGPVGNEIYNNLLALSKDTIEYIHFLDDNPEKQIENPNLIVGKLDDIREICLRERITDFIIALPPRAYSKINDLVSTLIDIPVQIWLIPDYFHIAMSRIEIDEINGMPMINLRASSLNDSQRFVKRVFDIFIALVSLIPGIPTMLIIGILILIKDGKPIFFKQPRVGENGKTFMIYKFRTMVNNAEDLAESVMKLDENGNIIHKSKDDPRVTRVGRILRHYSLDELPQIFNVLLGNMSLVGPRPELPFLVKNYEPWQRKRFTVPPGMTGWWQINGRSNRPLHLNTEDDIYYIDHYSYWLDIKILFKTALMVLKGKGAY